MPDQSHAVGPQSEPQSDSATGYVTRLASSSSSASRALVGAVINVLFVLPAALHALNTGDEESTVVTIVVMAFLGCYLFVVYGLWTAKKWARAAFVIAVFNSSPLPSLRR